MGIFDNLVHLSRGAGRSTVELPLQAGEQEVLRVHATARPGGLRSVGGQLVLTTHRVAFVPWNTADISGVLAWVLPKVGAPGPAGQLVNRLQAAVDGAGRQLVAASVEAGGQGSVLSPPTVVITGTDGAREVFGVVAGVGSPNWSRRNGETRDGFVAAARRTLDR